MHKIIYSGLSVIGLMLFCSCASTASTSDIVSAGDDTYTVSIDIPGQGVSDPSVMDKLYQKANSFCVEQNKVLVPISESLPDDSGSAGKATAELRFRCAAPDETDLEKDEVLRVRRILDKRMKAS